MRTISQYDARRYKDELEGLREEMMDILIEMEHRQNTSSREAFDGWWDEGGAMRHYFDLKGRAERIEGILYSSVIEEEEYPKMRAQTGGRTGMGEYANDTAEESDDGFFDWE